ncbi:MAG TPA: hypothetical protein VFH83_12755, partial [Spirochaetia bacterium]|nr:hypothetical protein [Spirochaetia bacterium]
LSGSLQYQKRSQTAYQARRSLEGHAESVVAALASDPTPQSDSPLDPVWSLVGTSEDGTRLSLSDVSSALNPNWVQKNVFSKTSLKSTLASEGAADVLQQRREDRGLSEGIGDAYGDLFVEGALGRYFTAYGYANINVTDEFALQKLYAVRTGDSAAAEVFHSQVQRLLMDQRILKPDELRTFLGSAYDALYPVMSAEPCMNVHFVDPDVLTALLAYPELKVPHPAQAAQQILETRGRTELSQEDLVRIIGAPSTSRIYQYLGVVTWFWRISASSGASRVDLVVARVPESAEGPARNASPPRYATVEERLGSP